jgi:hypothetical protein
MIRYLHAICVVSLTNRSHSPVPGSGTCFFTTLSVGMGTTRQPFEQ